MKKLATKIFIGFLASIVVLLTGMTISGRNIVYYSPPASAYGEPVDSSKNSLGIYPFNELSFDEKDRWDAYIIFGPSDFENLQEDIKKKGGMVLHTSSNRLLKELKKMEFKWEGEIGTPDSDLVIMKNGKIIYVTAIFLDKGYVGLQSRRFGFAVPRKREQFISICAQFERLYSPLLVL